jgi:serine/threonine protein kinase/tetratricopeptide (TPR) repeat protein
MIDEHVSHYRILDTLGRGGMGVVYRAVDTKLGREVALKFLPDGIGHDPEALDRFTREARSAAALNHPNICTIYEIGEHAGRPFIAMELLEGQTLADAIAGRPLPIALSIEIALHIASALEAAHAKGIIHRDIKPANILVTSLNVAKVLDFGLAKTSGKAAAGSPDSATVAGSNVTGAGSTLGTIAYMSPEQARGADLDGRSDLFSLGLVLYEMVTGRRAFDGETTAVIFDGILNRMPIAPSEINPDVPPGLEAVIAKAIEKDRSARYQSLAELASDLRLLRRSTDSGVSLTKMASSAAPSTSAWPSRATQSAASPTEAAAPAKKGSTWVRVLPVAAVLLIALIIAAWQLRGPSEALGASDVILIADFDNTTGDAVFDGTLKQALAVKLEESPFLNVLSDQRVRETLGFMNRAADTQVTAAVAREICQRQGIKAVMLGSIASLGSTYVMTLAAENCSTGDVLAREQATAASKEQVLSALGSAASQIRSKLGESLASIARTDKPIEEATTSSLDAFKAFSLGKQKRSTSTDQEAIPFFRRAIELDPDFALAYAQLGTIYSNLGEEKRGKEHRQRAYDLRDRVSRRERLYIEAHYHNGVANDPEKALSTYDVWKQEYPRDPVPYVNSGTLYAGRGEQERALESYMTALELDPRQLQAYRNAFGNLLELDRFDEAKKLVQRQIEALGATPEASLRLYEIAARQRDRTVTDSYAAKFENTPVEMDWLAMRSAEMAFYGQLREARRLADRQIELMKRQGLSERIPLTRASLAAAAAMLGQLDMAREEARAAATLNGSGADYRINLAFTYVALRDIKAAREQFQSFGDQIRGPVRELLDNCFEASVAIASNRPQDALARLDTIRQDTGTSLRMNALVARADALRLLGRFAEAERVYREALAFTGPGAFSLTYPNAQVGLARTLAAAGNAPAAREEYQKFLALWSKADDDLVLLRQVKAELARLGT